MAFLYYSSVGDRYEAYTLLRVGQGIKERSDNKSLPFGEGIDLQSRMESLARIARIDYVVQQAAAQTGYDRLFPKAQKTLMSEYRKTFHANVWVPIEESFLKFWGLNDDADLGGASAKEGGSEPNAQVAEENRLIRGLSNQISARQEGRSDLLRISFRHKDSRVAADYLNELGSVLVAAQNADVQVPGAQEFFQQQTKRLENEAELAAAELKNFSVKASIYEVDEQRQLLLRRANELGSMIASARGNIEEKKGQRRSIAEQLLIMRPVSQSKTVTGIVNTLGGREAKASSEARGTVPDFEEAPPLLLVKVYQDAMADLLKINTDIAGSTHRLNQLSAELDNVNKELASLASKEAEYGRLKREFTAASEAAGRYASRMLEEEITSEVVKKTQLSSLRVVQIAVPETDPIFPRVPQLIGLALVGGILLGFAAIVGPELAKWATNTHQSRGANVVDVDVKDYDPVNLFVIRQAKDG
jgi:uncharacterized protein involved in exopolysaccharide biosynthesis